MTTRPYTPTLLLSTAAALALALTCSTTEAQEMSFGVDEAQPKIAIQAIGLDVVPKKARKPIITRVSDYVDGLGTFQIVSEGELKGSVGRKEWATFQKCPDAVCMIPLAQAMGLDRLVVVSFSKQDGGIYAVDIELDDVINGLVLNYTVAVTDDPTEVTFLDQPMDELVNGQNDVGQGVAQAGVGNSGGGGGGGEAVPEVPSEPFVLTPLYSYITFGVGGLALGLGALFGSIASGIDDEIKESPHEMAEVDKLIADGQSNQELANIFFISGFGIVGVGALLYWLSEDAPEEKKGGGIFGETSELSIGISPQGVGVRLRY